MEAIRRTAKANGLNLVVVVADTLRLDHVGAYGATRAKTPCLDELARQSVVFENAFADGLPTFPPAASFTRAKPCCRAPLGTPCCRDRSVWRKFSMPMDSGAAWSPTLTTTSAPA